MNLRIIKMSTLFDKNESRHFIIYSIMIVSIIKVYPGIAVGITIKVYKRVS